MYIKFELLLMRVLTVTYLLVQNSVKSNSYLSHLSKIQNLFMGEKFEQKYNDINMAQVGFKPTSMRTFNFLIFYFTIAYKKWIIISTQTPLHLRSHSVTVCDDEARKFLAVTKTVFQILEHFQPSTYVVIGCWV